MSKNNILVSTINGAGSVIETIYVVVFIIYAAKKEKGKILGLLTLVLAIFTGVALVSLFALHGNARKLFCGCAAAIFSIIMYGSPLSIMVSHVTLQVFHSIFAVPLSRKLLYQSWAQIELSPAGLFKLLGQRVTGFILACSVRPFYKSRHQRVLCSGYVD